MHSDKVDHATGAHEPHTDPDLTPSSADSPESAWEMCVSAVKAYFYRLRGAGKPGPPILNPTWDAIVTFVFASGSMMILAVIEAFGLQPYDKGLLSFLPSFGASCAVIFFLVTPPGAQPRGMVLTHLMGAFLGVSWAHVTNNLPKPLSQLLASTFAVSMLTPMTMFFRSFQPSSSATACLGAFHLYGQMNDKGYMFLVTPALLGPCVLAVLGVLLNNLIPWRHCYPVFW